MSTSKNNPLTLNILLGCLIGLTPFATDMYLPAFPFISKAMKVNTGTIVLSMSSFFAAWSLGSYYMALYQIGIAESNTGLLTTVNGCGFLLTDHSNKSY